MVNPQKNKVINKKYLTGILLSFVVLLFPGVPFIIGLVVVWLSIGIATIKSPGTGLVGICFIESFYGFVRWKDFSSVLLAGFSFEIIMVFLIGVVLYRLMHGKSVVVARNFSIFDITFSMFILWFCARSIFYANNPLEIGLIFRQFILIPLSFFAISFILRKNSEISKYVLMALCLGAASLAMINIVHYFYGLSIPWARFYTDNSGFVNYRTLFGFKVNRINPLVIGQGPGGAGVFYMVLAAVSLGCLLFIKMRTFWKFVLAVAFCVLMITALCAVAYSAFLVILIALFVMVQQMKMSTKKVIRICLLFCLLPLLMYGSIIGNNADGDKTASYISKISKYTFSVIPDFGSFEFIFGSGPAIKTGGLLHADRGNMDLDMLQKSHDQWWFVVLNQVGIIGLLLVVIFVFFAAAKYFKIVSKGFEAYSNYLPCAGILFFGLFGYMHGFPLFVQPLDFLFVIALSLIMTSSAVIPIKTINDSKAKGAFKEIYDNG